MLLLSPNPLVSVKTRVECHLCPFFVAGCGLADANERPQMRLLGYRVVPCVFSVKHENRFLAEELNVIMMVKTCTM